MQRGWTVGRARSNACRVRSKRRNSAESGCADAAFACHLRHLLSPHPYHTLRRKLEAGTPLPMSLRAFAVARAAEGRSARAGRDLQQRRPPLYVCYYYPLVADPSLDQQSVTQNAKAQSQTAPPHATAPTRTAVGGNNGWLDFCSDAHGHRRTWLMHAAGCVMAAIADTLRALTASSKCLRTSRAIRV